MYSIRLAEMYVCMTTMYPRLANILKVNVKSKSILFIKTLHVILTRQHFFKLLLDRIRSETLEDQAEETQLA